MLKKENKIFKNFYNNLVGKLITLSKEMTGKILKILFQKEEIG